MAVDLYNTTAYKLRDTNNILDILSKSIAIDIPGIVELDLITSEYNIIDLDIPRAKSRAQPDIKEGDLIEAANILYIISQYHNPPLFRGLNN
jgi:hypothetical protein